MKNHRQYSNGENSFTDTFCSWYLKGTCMISPCPLSKTLEFLIKFPLLVISSSNYFPSLERMRREKNLATSSSFACFFDKMSLEFGFWLIALHAKIFLSHLSHFLFSLVLVVFSIETDPFPVLPVKVSCVLSVSTKKNIKYTIHKSSWKRKKLFKKLKAWVIHARNEGCNISLLTFRAASQK